MGLATSTTNAIHRSRTAWSANSVAGDAVPLSRSMRSATNLASATSVRAASRSRNSTRRNAGHTGCTKCQ
jgi:hypothetical protein